MSTKSLTGQIALVTGSGRGLGYAVAERLAELGAHVAIHDVTADAPAQYGEFPNIDAVVTSVSRHGTNVIGVLGDVSDEEAVQDFVAETQARLGPISILVNIAGGDIGAAGIKPDPNDALHVPLVDIQSMLNRNLLGTMLLCRAVCPGMIERKRGTVVNTASVAAQVGVTNGVIYAVAKAGIIEWTRCLAADLREHNVRVNCISPGPTVTARFLATRHADPAMTEVSDTLVRYGQPAELADAFAFLCSDASRYVSGQVLRVDGGLQTFAG